jgi:hypothetical protein
MRAMEERDRTQAQGQHCSRPGKAGEVPIPRLFSRRPGKRSGLGVPFSVDAVKASFQRPEDYNEWTGADADPVGIFVNLADSPLLVPQLVDPNRDTRL